MPCCRQWMLLFQCLLENYCKIVILKPRRFLTVLRTPTVSEILPSSEYKWIMNVSELLANLQDIQSQKLICKSWQEKVPCLVATFQWILIDTS